MPNLPEWVLKYKTKGVYARKTKNGYALYRGHSERIKGKSYPVFRCDEYLGIVTEEKGLVPSSPPVKPGIRVLRYGLARIIESSCALLRKNPQRIGFDGELLFVRAVLSIEGRENRNGYETSYLSLMFPSLNLERELTVEEQSQLRTMKTQIPSKLRQRFRQDTDELLELSSDLYAVFVNESWHLSYRDERLISLAAKHAVLLDLGGSRR